MKRLAFTICLLLPIGLLLGWLGLVVPSVSEANQATELHQDSLVHHGVIRPYQKKGGLSALAEQEHVRKDSMVLAPRLVVVLSDYLQAAFSASNELQRYFMRPALSVLNRSLFAVPTLACHRLLRTVLQPNAP